MFLFILKVFYLFFVIPSGIRCNEEDDDASDFNQFYTDGNTALTLRDSANNQTKYGGCVYKYEVTKCPDSDIRFYYYSGHGKRKRKLDTMKKNSLAETRWDPGKDNVIFIHGYGGSAGAFPNYIVRDAYVRNGSYNVFMVDWSRLARFPCYSAAIYNLNPVAKCTASLYNHLRSQGVPSHRITCVGHSLGAHGCGLVSNYVNFRMHRIIGLDPAGPMIPSSTRLRSGMAENVQVMHTNAGVLGESTSGGSVNFCMNGGKRQPYCDSSSIGPDLCSHIMVVCYMAESVDGSTARMAVPCSRQCPYGPRLSTRAAYPVMIGQHTPDRVSGSYCVYSNDPPYCPSANNPNGDPWCCMNRRATKKDKEFSKEWNKHKPVV